VPAQLLILSISVCLASLVSAAMAQPICSPLPPPSGTIVEVDPDDAGQLKSRISSAGSGTTILLHDGFYDMSSGGSSQLVFATPGVTLRSFSGDRGAVILDGGYGTGELVSIYASNVTIADLTLQRAY